MTSKELFAEHMNRRSKILCRMAAWIFIGSIFIPLLVYGVCRGADEESKIPVFVSILPQRYFVIKIGGPRIHVSTMVLPGANPHTFEPRPRQMVELVKAKVYFAAGVPFETTWLVRIASANPRMVIVHTDAGIEKKNMYMHQYPEAESISRSQPADHALRFQKSRNGHLHEGEKDPHTWLSPPLAKIHARNILNALVDVDPSFRGLYEANYQKLETEIDAVDSRLKDVFSGVGQRTAFMVFHPAWGYFAETYNLKQVPVEVEGKEPKPADLRHLILWAKNNNVKVVFTQKQFSAKSAEVIAGAINGQVIYADPLAEEWSENLLFVAEKFREALR